MSRLKGTPKTGGRKAGTPNKISVGLKDFISKLLFKNRKQMERDLQELQPKERLLILEKMMQYVIPKQREFDISADLNRDEDEQKKRDMEFLESLPDDVMADISDIILDWQQKKRQEQLKQTEVDL